MSAALLQHRATRWVAAAAVLTAAALSWSLFAAGPRAGVNARTDAAFPWSRTPTARPDHAAAPSWVSGVENLPASLQGTDVDGALGVDAQGRLRLDHGVRQLFDYFLSTVGEEPLETVRARLHAYIHQHLPAMAAAQAEDLLQRYLSYESARATLPVTGTSSALQGLQDRQQALQSLQQQYFSPAEIQAFFDDDNALARFTLERLNILQDQTLSAHDKLQRLADAKTALPVTLREAVGAEDDYQTLAAFTADWHARGGSAQELRQAREQLVGDAAADRLEALDTERQQWGQRVQEYESQRAVLTGDPGLSTVQRTQAIAQLRERMFTPEERLRLAARDSPP